MKLSWKIFAVAIVVSGIAYGSNAKDRARWLAALGVSQATATQLRVENSRDRYHADRAEEQARWRANDHVQPADVSAKDTVLSSEDVCKGLAAKEDLLRGQGKAAEAASQRIKAVCGGDSSRYAY
jgi:hypothetical protein